MSSSTAPGRGHQRRVLAAPCPGRRAAPGRAGPSRTSVPSSAARRRARSSGEAVRKTFTAASGATTVPMSRPSATQSPSASSSRCFLHERLAHRRVGGHLRGRLGDLRRADRLGHVLAVHEHAVAEPDVELLGALGGRAAVSLRHQPDRAVHRARVQVGEAERARDSARNGALARPRGPVDRHDHGRQATRRAWSRSGAPQMVIRRHRPDGAPRYATLSAISAARPAGFVPSPRCDRRRGPQRRRRESVAARAIAGADRWPRSAAGALRSDVL